VQAEASKNDLDGIKDITNDEYVTLLAILRGFLEDFYNNPSLYMTHTELMEQRAVFALNHAFNGYGLSFERAMNIVKLENNDGLTDIQIEERDMLIGLIDNIINFSVAAEHQTLMSISEDREKSVDMEEFMITAINTFSKYNKTYAGIENEDIFFALGLAAEWLRFDAETILQFTTQGDERVRDSHNAINGLRYRKKDFPAALIPPIDHGCRCYLIDTGSTDGRKLTNKPNVSKLIDDATNPAFKYNVATSGQMFGEDHPYFEIGSSYLSILGATVTKIKSNLGL